MGRGWAWLAAGAIAGYAGACGDVSAFACQSDADCVLTGTPGICEAGNCAYPDADCPSGFSYPVVTPGIGGECVAGAGATGDTGDDPGPGTESGGATPTSDDDGGGTVAIDDTGVDDGTTSTTAMTAGATSSESFTVTSDSGTDDGSEVGSGDTGPVCGDDVGDSPITSSTVGGCEVLLESDISDADDEDWFSFFGPGGSCPEGVYNANLEDSDDVGLMLCLFAGCEGGDPSSADCIDGSEPTTMFGFEGCCGDSVLADLACLATPLDDLDPFILVTSTSADPVCSPYVVELLPAE